MTNQNSFEEIVEIHSLLEDIKQEYTQGIRHVLQKNDPDLFKNVHTIPKLEKIQINRGLGLAAQNKNILKKSIEEFRVITGQKPIITRSKNAIATFKIREDMELGLTVTLRNEKIEADEFLVKKKEPLSMPPDFDTLPSPGDGSQEALKEKEALEKLFNVRKDSSTKKSNSKSTENSILKQIQK